MGISKPQSNTKPLKRHEHMHIIHIHLSICDSKNPGEGITIIHNTQYSTHLLTTQLQGKHSITTAHHSTPQHTTTHHNTPQHTTAHHSTPQHTTAHHSTPQHTTAHHSTPHHTTAHDSTPQHITAHHNTPQHNINNTIATGFNGNKPAERTIVIALDMS